MSVLESHAETSTELEKTRRRRARAVRWMQNEVRHLADVNIADLREAVAQTAAEPESEIVFARREQRRLGRTNAEVRELGDAALEIVDEMKSGRATAMDVRHELRDVRPRQALGDA